MKKHLLPWRKKNNLVRPEVEEGHPFVALQRHMNDLFEDFFGAFGESCWPSPQRNDQGWTKGLSPSLEVTETEDDIKVTVELPGMDEKDIEVTLDEHLLTITGEKREEREDKKKNYYLAERRYGQFHRTIPIPEGIDKDKVKARFKKGILYLTLPKTEQAKSQRKHIDVVAE